MIWPSFGSHWGRWIEVCHRRPDWIAKVEGGAARARSFLVQQRQPVSDPSLFATHHLRRPTRSNPSCAPLYIPSHPRHELRPPAAESTTKQGQWRPAPQVRCWIDSIDRSACVCVRSTVDGVDISNAVDAGGSTHHQANRPIRLTSTGPSAHPSNSYPGDDVLARLADPVVLHVLSFLTAPELGPLLATGKRWQPLATR